MQRHLPVLVAIAGLTLLTAGEAQAMAPRFVGDEELAAYPIIVVAKWNKAPVKPHHRYTAPGEGITKIEVFTQLTVLAVVKGELAPGEHDLLMNWGIAWQDDGAYVNSGTTTELPGDVNDVTAPCLWFLQRTRSWDEKLKSEYLTVANYREIQPLELKEFYVALGKREAHVEVPKLLAPDKPLVARRVLRYLCGGVWPWPYDGWRYSTPAKQGAALRDEANRVWDYLQANVKDQRPWAACVYAELAGKNGLAKMRALLDDKDPSVRGIAVGILSRARDVATLERFAQATQRLTDATIACRVIKELSAWNDERTVPALIGFLQNDGLAYRIGDDFGIPALKAHQALLAITGHEFPYDIETSQKAWQEALRLDDKAARKQLLEKAAPGGKAPLVAAAIGLPSKELSEGLKQQYDALADDEFVITIRLRNLSSRPVTILAYPSEVELRSPGGFTSRGSADDKKPEFTTLEASYGVVLETVVTKDFLIAEPAERKLKLSYLANGNNEGVKAWMGTIHVGFGADWKYERVVKQVEETWENGNLKATGTTVNGEPLGEWNYYSEAGDRIKVSYPGTGRDTAISNPDHPQNKGAGKRPAK